MSAFYRIFDPEEPWTAAERRKRELDALLRAACLAAYHRTPFTVEDPSGARRVVTQYGTLKKAAS